MKHLIGLFVLAALASAQVRTIETGTTVSIRTNESIDAKKDDGRIYSGVVDQDVTDSRGNIAIPRGSSAELVVRKLEDKQLSLDLEAVTVNGQRYATTAEDSTLGDSRKDGVGTNERTAKYVGGGALLGAVVGAIAGGGKGAAIGAAAGAGAGAGAQVLTRGKSVRVPAESLLTFRLQQPLGVGAPDSGTTRNGKRYLKRRR